MRVGIFYFSYRPVDGAQEIALPLGGNVWIRVVEHEGDLSQALDDAGDDMRDGESVMNTHYLNAESEAEGDRRDEEAKRAREAAGVER